MVSKEARNVRNSYFQQGNSGLIRENPAPSTCATRKCAITIYAKGISITPHQLRYVYCKCSPDHVTCTRDTQSHTRHSPQLQMNKRCRPASLLFSCSHIVS
jgi:hypothetical protein